MSVESSRPSDSYGLWLVLSCGLVTCAAVFAAARVKPPLVFALGFGLAIGLGLRFLAIWLQVPLDRRVVSIAVLLSLAGFGLCFALGYRRAALDWKRVQGADQQNAALAEALLNSFPEADRHSLPSPELRFNFPNYLSGRVPGWPAPWPMVLWGAEWTACVLTTGVCLGKRRRTPDHVLENAS